MDKILLVALLYFIGTVPCSLAGVHNAKDVINNDGTLNEKYEFVNGKYFLKDEYKAQLAADSETQAQYYSQCVDHFSNPPCQSTFQQRYWVNWNYYQAGGPIFFWLGAEGPEDGRVDGGEWLWVGYLKNAVFVVAEHRDYGQSYVTTDQSANGLKTLSSQQALADYSQFIRWFKQQNGLTNAKTVCVGGSYGGNLAAWFREKYPSDCNVAWSSSGPLNATFDMFQYIKTVEEVIYYTNSDCYDALGKIFYCMQNIALGNYGCSPSVTDRSQLPSAVRYCYSVDWNNQQQPQWFFNAEAYEVWGSNYPRTQDEPRCQKLLTRYNQYPNDPIQAYGAFLSDIGISWGCSGEPKALGSQQTDARSWFWQTCNEMGYYQSSDPTYCLFGCNTWSADVYADQCRGYWGSGYTDNYIQGRTVYTNNDYGGHDNTGTCIVFVNGGYDPWHYLGDYQQSQTNSQNTVVYIPTGEHCSDLNHDDNNPQDVKDAQTQIQQAIFNYLASSSC